MLENITFGLNALEDRPLTPDQWAALQGRLMARARHHRNEAIRALSRAAYRGLCRIAGSMRTQIVAWLGHARAAIARRWEAYQAAGRRRRAVTQLNALDDRDLKDIGLRRCEIYSAVYRHDAARGNGGRRIAPSFRGAGAVQPANPEFRHRC